jgi:hypothetical protein
VDDIKDAMEGLETTAESAPDEYDAGDLQSDA